MKFGRQLSQSIMASSPHGVAIYTMHVGPSGLRQPQEQAASADDQLMALICPQTQCSMVQEVSQPRCGGIAAAAALAEDLANVSSQVAQTAETNTTLIQQLQSQLLQCQSLAIQMQQAQWAGICL